MSDTVFHFSDTLRLPWIVADGELRPSFNSYWGDKRYLWATLNPDGDQTARPLRNKCNEDYEHGKVLIIRFTCPATGFISWRRLARNLSWTAEQIAELETSDRRDFGEHGFARWRCRRTALPLSSILKVEAWQGGWRPIQATRRCCCEISDDPPTMVSRIGGFEYYSTIEAGSPNWLPYCRVPDREELAAMWEDAANDCWNSDRYRRLAVQRPATWRRRHAGQ